jgi:aldehyde:ferredoxin oxidoreductase
MDSKVFGYAGTLLYVDLTGRQVRKKPLRPELVKNYVGGSGLAAKLFHDQISEPIEPLSSKNVLIFMSGPLTGTLIPMSGKWAVSSLSPLTNAWGEANSGAWWGAELKFAGYDGVIIEGKAENPVYILVDDENVSIRSAKDLWGLSTSKTMLSLMKDYGSDISVACIGPAGENLVKIASIINEHGGAAARCGLGAVMGSKNLKAVAVRGSKGIQYADPQRLARLVEKISIRVKESPAYKNFSRFGTTRSMESSHELGDLPIKYWKESQWLEGAQELSGITTVSRMPVKGVACFACSVGCGTAVKLAFRSKEREWDFGPEYETSAALGTLCMNKDFKSVVKAHNLCNDYGIDTISTGSLIAFSMECYEKGFIPKELLKDLDLSWGNAESIVTLVGMIARREDLGRILSEGIREASSIFGEEASKLAVHVKGLDPAMHDPRATPGFGLLYATAPIGASHGRGVVSLFDKGKYSPEEVAKKVIEGQHVAAFMDSAVLCKFGALMKAFNLDDMSEFMISATGWELNNSDILGVGERIYNLTRIINLRRGVDGTQDTLPEVFLKTPRTIGNQKVVVASFDEMIQHYYLLRSWNEQGIPSKRKREELGLSQDSL